MNELNLPAAEVTEMPWSSRWEVEVRYRRDLYQRNHGPVTDFDSLQAAKDWLVAAKAEAGDELSYWQITEVARRTVAFLSYDV